MWRRLALCVIIICDIRFAYATRFINKLLSNHLEFVFSRHLLPEWTSPTLGIFNFLFSSSDRLPYYGSWSMCPPSHNAANSPSDFLQNHPILSAAAFKEWIGAAAKWHDWICLTQAIEERGGYHREQFCGLLTLLWETASSHLNLHSLIRSVRSLHNRLTRERLRNIPGQ